MGIEKKYTSQITEKVVGSEDRKKKLWDSISERNKGKNKEYRYIYIILMTRRKDTDIKYRSINQYKHLTPT